MENIHVIATPNPSRLVKQKYDTIDRLCLADIATKRAEYKRFNIYITSDEEIKEGDSCLDFDKDLVKYDEKQYNMLFHNVCKKIILTTDGDLIKDGVQAIDDEFLEWFVKNPSCEWVEVIKVCSTGRKCDGKSKNCNTAKYKIIIPKEEQKQHKIMERFIANAKQETLEEVALKYAESNQYDLEYYDEGGYRGIEVKSFAEKLVDFTTKWNQERSYSEEDMLKFAQKYAVNTLDKSHIEQFKKK